MQEPTAVLARHAQGRHGVFARADAERVGVSRSTLRSIVARGWCEPVGHGVYRVVGAPQTNEQRLAIAVARREGSVAADRGAAWLWGAGSLLPFAATVMVERGRNHRDRGGSVRSTLWLPPAHVTVRSGLPVTTVARTVFDLAGSEPSGRVEAVLDAFLTRRLCTLGQVERVYFALAGRGRGGTVAMKEILAARTDRVVVPASELERVARSLFRAGGLPPAEFEIDLGGDAFIGRVDCLWRSARLVVELDGRRFHGGATARDADRRRDNQMMAEGWRVLRFTWQDLTERPDEVLRLIRLAISR